MDINGLKENVESWWSNVAEGWRQLRHSASGALTRFKPSDQTNLPESSTIDDDTWLSGLSWSMLGVDLLEDDRRLVARLEIPGIDKDDLKIEVVDDALVISGEKRFEHDSSDGRWRTIQCAYGAFRRVVPLPAPVRADQAKASYRNGVLRVELPKIEPGPARSVTISVQ